MPRKLQTVVEHAIELANAAVDNPTDELVADGARAASSPKEAAQVDVLHTMLGDDHAVESVLFDADALGAIPPGSVHVNHATISVALAKQLAERHRERDIGYVAAPVF